MSLLLSDVSDICFIFFYRFVLHTQYTALKSTTVHLHENSSGFLLIWSVPQPVGVKTRLGKNLGRHRKIHTSLFSTRLIQFRVTEIHGKELKKKTTTFFCISGLQHVPKCVTMPKIYDKFSLYFWNIVFFWY